MKIFDGIERLRGFACILVLIQHIVWICPMRFVYENLPHSLLNAGGGMRVFFAISGFVITLSLKNRINVLQGDLFLDRVFSAKELLLSFYKKRFFRIFPVVFFVVILLGIFLNFTEENLAWAPSLLRAPAEIFFGVFNNSVELFVTSEKIHTGGLGPLWTLAVEAQFYIFWPLILLFCKDDSTRATVSLSLGFLFMFLLQPILSAMYGTKYYIIYNNLSELFLGAFLAFLYQDKSSIKFNPKLAKLSVITLAMLIWFYPNSLDKAFFSNIVVSFSSVLLVALAVFVDGSCDLPIFNKIFDYLGSRSFSFYAVQLTLANIVVWYTNSIHFPKESFYEYEFFRYQFIIFIVVLLVVSELMYRFIERPFRKLGRK
ncbi:MAG: acyltransferase [Holosporaceae bacterium]|jgi:peptidoglycan/LPS O-acetylase OafA/YrhL|nr:acyltransferase [Holosporaceae bacterium]